MQEGLEAESTEQQNTNPIENEQARIQRKMKEWQKFMREQREKEAERVMVTSEKK